MREAPDSSAADTLAETLARLGAADPLNLTEERSAKGSVEGSEKGSGSGYDLPALANLQWEPNAKGGWEAWHSPPGAIRRRDRTYLGYLGKRQLEAWQAKTPAEFDEAVRAWIEQKRAEKL